MDKDELAQWLRNPVTQTLLAALANRFPEGRWKQIISTEPHPTINLGREQGKQEAIDYVRETEWARE